MSREDWTPESVTRVLMDPRYCLSEPAVIADEQWIEANAKLIGRWERKPISQPS
jgi:hypothetical protein